MPNQVSFVSNAGSVLAHYELLRVLRLFLGGFGVIGTIGGTRTGNGTITGVEAAPSAVTETWTLTCTATAVNSGTFSVSGSASGARAAATVGTPYNNGLISFTINDGSVDYALNDVFQVPVTRGAMSAANAAWAVLRYDDVSTNRELILRGRGFSGADEIFVGLRTYHDAAADYYNLLCGGFTGYVAGNSFDTQPGAILCGVPAHNQRIDYWLSANAQRFAVAMKVGTPVYESFYLGKMLPYGTPSQYPYPLVCGAPLGGAAATRFSETTHRMPYKGNHAGMRLRFNSGAWLEPRCWPHDNPNLANVNANTTFRLRDTNGQYPLLPFVLHDASANVYGELDGVYWIPGFNNVVENTLSVGGVNHVVIQDVGRTGHIDYYALRLDA